MHCSAVAIVMATTISVGRTLLSGVYARGSKKSHTRGKCVTCLSVCGLEQKATLLKKVRQSCSGKRCPAINMTWKKCYVTHSESLCNTQTGCNVGGGHDQPPDVCG